MVDDGTYQRLLTAAFRFLSFRPRSSKETEEYLHKKTKKVFVAPEIFKRVMARLVELGYIDDVTFAAWWIESRQKTKPKGMRLIKFELKKKGIDTGEIVEIPEDEIARRAIRKKIETWKRLPKLDQKKKLYNFLGRRGFSYNTIARVIDSTIGNRYNKDEVE